MLLQTAHSRFYIGNSTLRGQVIAVVGGVGSCNEVQEIGTFSHWGVKVGFQPL